MNLIEIAGYLVADAEERFLPNGQKVITFRMGAKSRKKGQDETIWYRVTIWGDRFDFMKPFLKKGTGLIVIGELQKPRLFTNRENQQQLADLEVTAEIIRFSPFGRSGSSTGQERQGERMTAEKEEKAAFETTPAFAAEESGFAEDDLPF